MYTSATPFVLASGRVDLPLPWAHCLATLVSVLVALAVLLRTPRIFPLSRRKEIGFAAASLGAGGALAISFSSAGAVAPGWGWAGFAAASFAATWLSLSWQEYLATQGARAAVLGFACMTLLGIALFFIVGFFPQKVALVVCVVLPIAADLSLRPHRGARFFANIDQPFGTRELCRTIAHDWSPRLMAIICMLALVYGAVRTAAASQETSAGVGLWIRAAGGMSVASVVAGLVIFYAQKRGIIKAFYVALPLSACAVVVFAMPFDTHAETAVFMASCGYNLVYYMVWIVMLEKACSRQLPVLGLFASLWLASYVGILAGQVTALLWPVDPVYLNYLMLLIVVAASLLLVRMNGKLVVSKDTMNSPEESPIAQKALEIAEEAKLSPRETEILTIWLNGHNAAYIEETLHISRNTVKTHLKHIYQKTGIASKEDLLRMRED